MLVYMYIRQISPLKRRTNQDKIYSQWAITIKLSRSNKYHFFLKKKYQSDNYKFKFKSTAAIILFILIIF